jgi:hypothetical protein
MRPTAVWQKLRGNRAKHGISFHVSQGRALSFCHQSHAFAVKKIYKISRYDKNNKKIFQFYKISSKLPRLARPTPAASIYN